MQPIAKQERQVIDCNHSFSNNIKSNKSSNLFGLKIIFVFAGLNMGGAERQGILFADYLKNRHKIYCKWIKYFSEDFLWFITNSFNGIA